MKKQYYYLVISLPPLELGSPPELSFDFFSHLLHLTLRSDDLLQTTVIRRFYDLQNVRHYFKNEPLDPHGNLDLAELEQALASKSELPEYLFDFLSKYEHPNDRIKNFSELIAAYFREESANAEGFLADYLSLEQGLRLVFTAYRAKQLNRDLVKELQFEDPHDDLVARLIAQKDAKHFEFPDDFEELKPFLEKAGQDPLQLYQAVNEYKWIKLEEFTGYETFSIDNILAYLVKLIMVDEWVALDKKKGMEIAGIYTQ